MSLRGEAVAISRLLRSLRFLAMTSKLEFLPKNSNARFSKSARIKMEKSGERRWENVFGFLCGTGNTVQE